MYSRAAITVELACYMGNQHDEQALFELSFSQLRIAVTAHSACIQALLFKTRDRIRRITPALTYLTNTRVGHGL